MTIVRVCLALFMNALFFASDAAYVDNLSKCSAKDNDCLKSIHETTILEYLKHGFPELNLPPLEPMVLNNVSVPVSEGFSFTLINGAVKGITSCTYHNFNVDLVKKRETLALMCDLTIEGKMVVTGKGKSMKSMFGKSSIVSHGLGKLSFDNMKIMSYTKFKFFKKDDGQVYWVYDTDDVKYSYDVQKVTFNGNNFFVENTDISNTLVEYFNSNWRVIVDNIRDKLLSQSMEHYFAYLSKIFGNIPTGGYIIDDLSLYL